MDSVVDMYFALSHFRKIMERGASCPAGFFNLLDKDASGSIEAAELRHFFRHADVDCLDGVAAALAAEGISVIRLADMVFSVLDHNKNGKVLFTDLQRQLALVAAPGTSLIEFVGHVEMKHGLGRGGLSKDMDFTQFYNHLCQKELLDMAPEDASRLFRIACTPRRLLERGHFDNLLRRLPVEAAWVVEPYAANQLYCALGAHLLQLERKSRQEHSLPPEAMLTPLEGNALPDRAALRGDFEKLWERCAPSLLSDGPVTVSMERQLREACFAQYLEAAQAAVEARDRGRGACGAGPRSLFPSIGDVLATASTRFRAGQSCIVRYRLQGSSNFLHPSHVVLRDEREPQAWPVPRKTLGDSPFIGLMPRGLRHTPAGGGGFYLDKKAFSSVDPNMRAYLPRDPASGMPLLFGHVELVAPSLSRAARAAGSKSPDLAADFELRLCCSSKQRITGCIGDPLPIQVVHPSRPPPVASVQVRCEGQYATIRWSVLDLGPHAATAPVESICLHLRNDTIERTVNLDDNSKEYEIQDLSPDTDYEVKVRQENRVGHGREASSKFRTNACCSAPSSLSCAFASTMHVELRWLRPKQIGNETTRDQHQQRREAIERFETLLHVEELRTDMEEAVKILELPDAIAAQTAPRVCQWPAGTWAEDKDGTITVRLGSLRPDTAYCLENLCAVNSMGKGNPAKPLTFWTIPQTPRVAAVRVRHGSVFVALSQTGGVAVQEYDIEVCKKSFDDTKQSFRLPQSQLCIPFARERVASGNPSGGPSTPTTSATSAYSEIPVPFDAMPAVEVDETHVIQLRAKNPGGWSEWSKSFETVAIARQQGAEQTHAALLQAIDSRKIDRLTRLLEEVQGLEFSDNRHVKHAAELLEELEAVQHELDVAIEARDPEALRIALQMAREVRLPDLEKAEVLLTKLDTVVSQLESAKGIEALRTALRAAHEARLPAKMLENAVGQLGTREATQEALEQAMEAGCVPLLAAALQSAAGMHLPLQAAAEQLLVDLRGAQTLLLAAVAKGLMCDLVAALDAAASTNLKEEELIQKVRSKLSRLRDAQQKAQQQLRAAALARHPAELQAALADARIAQVPEDHLKQASVLLEEMGKILEKVEAAAGIDERKESLQAARAARLPQQLLTKADLQLRNLRNVHWALERGSLEVLRAAVKTAEASGVKPAELTNANTVFQSWSCATREFEVAMARQQALRLRKAIAAALAVGINADQLEAAEATLISLDQKNAAEVRLRHTKSTRQLEALAMCFRAACDADVANCPLLEETRCLLARLHHLRVGLTEPAELLTLHRLVERALQPPALPEDELEAAQAALHEARSREVAELIELLGKANKAGNYRAVSALVRRAQRSAEAGVQIEFTALKCAVEHAEKAERDFQDTLMHELQQQRVDHRFPRWTGAIPEYSESVFIPERAITGFLHVEYEHSGTLIDVLPREIVECTFVVHLPDSDDGACHDAVEAGSRIIQQLVQSLKQLASPEDTVQQLAEAPCRIVDENCNLSTGEVGSMDGRLELGMAIQVRASTCSGLDIVARICESNFPHADEDKEESGTVDRCSSDFRSSLRRVADHVRCVSSRVLRRITLDLAWSYPRGIMDSLDAACIAFDEDKIVEIIDRRGAQGLKYGAVSSNHREKYDRLHGAVRHTGDVMDTDSRFGKQVMTLRIDLLPKHVTDLFFVASTGNSRDLSKFQELHATLYDSDSMRVLAKTAPVSNCGGTEAAILCSVYHVKDGLWCVNDVGALCHGTCRNYRPILAKLRELGCPRSASMHDQVPTLLRSIQRELRTEREVKATRVETASSSTMTLHFALELFNNQSPSNVVQLISGDRFKNGLHAALSSSCGDRFSEGHISVGPAVLRLLHHIQVELCWKQPVVQSTSNGKAVRSWAGSEVAASMPQASNPIILQARDVLEGSCIMFEQQALREVVDDRGPHGVRWVCNGVLDFRGVWAGSLGISDATGGSVCHCGEHIDSATGTGMHTMTLRLDKVPECATDLYFVMSCPPSRDISDYGDLHVLLRDGDNPGHVIAAAHVGHLHKGGSAIVCALSRDNNDGWRLCTYGTTSDGNGQDYRPLLLCLRAMQEHKHVQIPCWPRQARDGDDCNARGLMLARLPARVDWGRRNSVRSMTSTWSAIDSIGSFSKQFSNWDTEENLRAPTVNSHLAWRGGSSAVRLHNDDVGPRIPTLNSALAWHGGAYSDTGRVATNSSLPWNRNTSV